MACPKFEQLELFSPIRWEPSWGSVLCGLSWRPSRPIFGAGAWELLEKKHPQACFGYFPSRGDLGEHVSSICLATPGARRAGLFCFSEFVVHRSEGRDQGAGGVTLVW